MMGMTAVLIMIYCATLFAIVLFVNKPGGKYKNWIFIALDVLFFLGLNIALCDYRSFRIQTFDNISPFTFTLIALMPFMKGKAEQTVKNAIAFLSVGMIIAMMISPQYAYLFNFIEEAKMDYLFDALCHLNCSLFGVYLVTSGQVKLDGKHFLRAVAFMYSVIATVVLMNVVFRTNFFGMCPYGGYSIYMFNLFEDYWATLFAYCLGVFVVLTIGFEFHFLLQKLSTPKPKKEKQNKNA